MSKDEETVTRSSPLFFQSSQDSLAFMITEQLLLQAGLTIVALVYIRTLIYPFNIMLICNHKMHGIDSFSWVSLFVLICRKQPENQWWVFRRGLDECV